MSNLKDFTALQALDTKFSSVFWDSYLEIPAVAEDWFSPPDLPAGVTPQSYSLDSYTYWTGGGVNGSPALKRTTDPTAVTTQTTYEEGLEVTMLPGFSKTMYFETRDLTLTFTKEDFDDSKFPKALGEVGDLAKVWRRFLNTERIRIFKFANASTDDLGRATTLPDGLNLASATHKYYDANGNVQTGSSTGWANYATGASTALGIDSLDTARKAMKNFKNNAGLRIQVSPDTLLIPPTLERTALEIMKSENKPYEISNTTNFFRIYTGGQYNIIVWDELQDALGNWSASYGGTAWWLIDSNLMKKNLIWFEREPLNYSTESPDANHTAKKRRTYEFYSWIRYGIGVKDWRWMYMARGQ